MITIEPPSTPSNPAATSSLLAKSGLAKSSLSKSSLAKPSLSKSGLSRFLNRARLAVGLPGEVEVLLTNDAELKRLNRSYRGKNQATDILSFPTPPEVAPHHAGDLAISLDTAARQAATFGHSLRDEVRILLLHGLLHLSGHDHETDHGEMAARESDLRHQLRLPNSLIDRVEARVEISPTRKKSTPKSPSPHKRARP